MVFYAGLAAGPMSVVAPVSALVSTVLPVGVAVATGEHLGGLVYALRRPNPKRRSFNFDTRAVGQRSANGRSILWR